MKKGTKKTLLIGGGILGTLVVAGLAYYFLVLKKDEDDTEEVADKAVETIIKQAFVKADTIDDQSQANSDAYWLLQKKKRELANKRRNDIVLQNGGSMNENALDNQMAMEEWQRVKDEEGITMFGLEKDSFSGPTTYAM